MTIDVWSQHPNSTFMSQPMFDSLKRWVKTMPAQGLPIEVTAAKMREAKIAKALLCAWYGPEGTLISNQEVRQHVRQFPDLFVGIASVDLRNPVQAIQELRTCVHEYQFKGLRIVQWLWDLPCTHRLYYPLFAECVQLKIPVCLQVGLTGPLKSSFTGKPHHIERVALDFPELKIVCGHIGYPWQNEMIAYATKFPHVYIDTSAYKPRRYPRELVDYMKHHGQEKVLFGTNYPMLDPKECVEQVDALGLDAIIKEKFLTKNAQRVFDLH